MLSGLKIKERVKLGEIIIEPFDEEQLGPNSYDLKLGENICVYTNKVLDVRSENPVKKFKIGSGGHRLLPNRLYLAHTVERAGSDFYVPCIEGRSSVARLGIQVHMTAGFGDIGFVGQWTLEIQVTHPIIIYPGMRICQIYFYNLIGERELYKGKYCKAHGVVPSLLWQDKEFLS